jgi:hypothetical protein
MMRKSKPCHFLRPFLIACFIGLSCLHAHADVAIDVNIKDMRPERPLQYRTQLMIAGERLKIDTTQLRPGEGKTEVLYDSSQRVLYFINHTEQSYIELDEVMLFDTIDGLDTVLRFLRKKMGVADEPKKSTFCQVRETDETRTIATLRSRKHLILCDGGVRQEVWVASWDEAGIEKETLQGVRKLSTAYEKVMANLGRVPLFREVEYVPTKGLFEIDGFAVAIQHFENGELLYEVQFSVPAEVNPNPLAFSVPESYERTWALD